MLACRSEFPTIASINVLKRWSGILNDIFYTFYTFSTIDIVFYYRYPIICMVWFGVETLKRTLPSSARGNSDFRCRKRELYKCKAYELHMSLNPL